MLRLDDHQDQAGAWDVIENAKGHLAFDVGGNIGQAATVLANRIKQVVSLEPCAESCEILKAESPQKV